MTDVSAPWRLQLLPSFTQSGYQGPIALFWVGLHQIEDIRNLLLTQR